MFPDTNNKFIRYFKNPLYGVSASTAYNFPNSLVHIPVIVMLVYSGVYICGAALKPLLALYFVVALYTARDLVIMAHKNKVIPVVIWGIFIPFIIFKKEVAGYLTLDSPQDSIAVTLALLVVFAAYISFFSRRVIK